MIDANKLSKDAFECIKSASGVPCKGCTYNNGSRKVIVCEDLLDDLLETVKEKWDEDFRHTKERLEKLADFCEFPYEKVRSLNNLLPDLDKTEDMCNFAHDNGIDIESVLVIVRMCLCEQNS